MSEVDVEAECASALADAGLRPMACGAAPVYVANRFSADEVQAIRGGSRHQLACSPIPPPSPETLPSRMIAFAFVYRAAVERHAELAGFSIAKILNTLHPRAPDLWARLEQGLARAWRSRPYWDRSEHRAEQTTASQREADKLVAADGTGVLRACVRVMRRR